MGHFWEKFYGPNLGYIEEQYEIYIDNPNEVDPEIRSLFDQYGAPITEGNDDWHVDLQTQSQFPIKKLKSAIELVEAIRRFGHLDSNIYPVGRRKNRNSSLVDPRAYGLTNEDLKNIPASYVWDKAPKNVQTGYDVIIYLKKRYTGNISFEFDHVNNDQERRWLLEQIESRALQVDYPSEKKLKLLKRLAEVEGFEQFLQKTFVGQKRFSIEGLEVMIPMLDTLGAYAVQDKIDHIMMGMAHRGRLSVLAHVLGKPVDKIFSEFHKAPDKELIPSEGFVANSYGWTGDVKYHFGASKELNNGTENKTKITLAHNPSHLEFVNPVVQGLARAAQDDRTNPGYPKQDCNKAFSVLIHGDAAFIGEGVVAETLNLSGLAGYHIGGTVHLIANNLLGYTTNQRDGRSTRYASDLAKGFEIPVIHVNADDPLACIYAVSLAYKYRKVFNKDILIDVVGYRRYGHNEMDEPRATQPLLYGEIDKHPTVATIYAEQLYNMGVFDDQAILGNIKKEIEAKLQHTFDSMHENKTADMEERTIPKALVNKLDRFETSVSIENLQAYNRELLGRPKGFKALDKVEKIHQRRSMMLDTGQKVDWGAGEALTYASILKDGIPIRLTGQDSERGTFAHRHMVLHNTLRPGKYCIMHGLDDVDVSFEVRNSPLSETGVLGFEYGYSVQSPNTLVIWEAQFGDFANAAQVIFDQFICASRAKWNEKSNMVMLLPHGYEGQGPEHSSARLERFLQMAAENNLIIANVTSSAQFFHLIRRQAAMRGREEARPLILMTPKSMLRNKRFASDPIAFTEGWFRPLREQANQADKKLAKRLLVGSGKIMVDIEEAMEQSGENFDWLHILRLEQIYPFPHIELAERMLELPNVEEIVWVQEEPKNMGAWSFVRDYLKDQLGETQELRCIGRPRRSAPAVGEPNIHKIVQTKIIQAAINPIKGGQSNERA